MSECSIEGCGKSPVVARGWCRTHYNRWHDTGSVELVPRTTEIKSCSVEDCSNDHYANDVCRMHYDRLRRLGTTEAPEAEDKPICTVDDCTNIVHARGWCQMHYRRVQKYGSLAVPVAKSKPGPRPTGAPTHHRLSLEELERRRVARQVTAPPSEGDLPRGRKIAGPDYCANGHAYAEFGGYNKRGNRTCKLCAKNAMRRSRGMPEVDETYVPQPRNAEKTHCAQGHPYTEKNTRIKTDGARTCRTCVRNGRIRAKYSLEPEDFDRMLTEQSNACAICGDEFTEELSNIHIDHDHDLGHVRGLLCGGCNTGIGHLRDSPEIILKAAEYIRLRSSPDHTDL